MPRHPLHLGTAGLVVVTLTVMWTEREAFPAPYNAQLWASEVHRRAALGATSDARAVSHTCVGTSVLHPTYEGRGLYFSVTVIALALI